MKISINPMTLASAIWSRITSIHKITWIIVVCILAITGCGSNPEKAASDTKYDTKKPATYTEYKQWRAENDPAAEKYAEFKQWELNYRRWKKQQEQK